MKLLKVTEMLLRHIERQKKKRFTFQGDIWDLQEIYECLENDKVSKAKRLICDLDTDPREQLPHFIWDWANED